MNWSYDGAECGYLCDNPYVWNGSSCVRCTGDTPTGVTKSTVDPTKDTAWFCATNTTAACSFTCPAGQECDGTTKCKNKIVPKCK
jgi:hypothetical protein